jgi:uncharacterized low-complexity protein
MKTLITTLSLLLAFAAAPVMATENPFSMGATAQIQTADAKDGKCGDSMKKEGKCGEGKCGEAMKKCLEGQSKEECMKEGKCGDSMKKDAEAKCGEGMKK